MKAVPHLCEADKTLALPESVKAPDRRRSRSLLMLTVTPLLIIVTAWLLIAWREPSPLPGLGFLGYTNDHYAETALVLLTNGSRVPLEVLPQIRDANVMQINGDYFHVPGFYSVWPGGLPRVVQPGKTTMLEVRLRSPDFREPWWTEIATRPQFPPSRLRDLAATIRQPNARRLAQRLFPPVQTTWTKLGPFTNLPPRWVRIRDRYTRRIQTLR